jgi:hypothetical protein
VSAEDLAKLEVWPDGSAIEIEDRDIHISVHGLMTAILPVMLPQGAVAAIFASPAGRATSQAKRSSAQANGRKGGRPRKSAKSGAGEPDYRRNFSAPESRHRQKIPRKPNSDAVDDPRAEKLPTKGLRIGFFCGEKRCRSGHQWTDLRRLPHFASRSAHRVPARRSSPFSYFRSMPAKYPPGPLVKCPAPRVDTSASATAA